MEGDGHQSMKWRQFAPKLVWQNQDVSSHEPRTIGRPWRRWKAVWQNFGSTTAWFPGFNGSFWIEWMEAPGFNPADW